MSPKNRKQTDTIIHLGAEAELWHTTEGRSFATIEVAGAHQNLEVESDTFRKWLARRFWEEEGTAASADALKRSVEVLAGISVYDGPEHEAFIRVARCADSIYLDLGCAEWHVIEITPEGWGVTLDPPVRFYRSPGLNELPWPQTGGSIDDLRPFVNVRDDEDFVLAVAWLLSALNSQGPFPIALIQGEQGSAKSTLTRVLRSLVDPATPAHTTRPRTERDLVISAHNSWVQAFDNLSTIPDWLSDALCRLATGGGFRTRRLYKDTEEIILQVCRPQILNGIDDLARRDDLRDRGILFELPVIPSRRRKRERTFWLDFQDAQPQILGALLDAISTALREESNVDEENLPRMADFAAWVIAAEKSLPWPQGAFLDAYERNRRDAITLVLEHSLWAERMIRFAEKNAPWDGTPTELYQHVGGRVLNSLRSHTNPASMSQELKRMSGALREVGVDMEWYRESDSNRTRKIAVRAVHAVQKRSHADEEPQSSGGGAHVPRDSLVANGHDPDSTLTIGEDQ